MSKHYTTMDGLFGSKIHYDENGNYAGQSMPGLFGDTMIHYDENGNYAGRTDPGLFGTQVHTDRNGQYAGQTTEGLFGQKIHTDVKGRTGQTWDCLFGSITDFDE